MRPLHRVQRSPKPSNDGTMSMETTGSDAGCQRKNDRVTRIFQGEEKILRVFIIIREGRVKTPVICLSARWQTWRNQSRRRVSAAESFLRKQRGLACKELPKPIHASLAASVANVDDQYLVSSRHIQQCKVRPADVVFSNTLEILEAWSALGMIDDRPLRCGQGCRRRHDVQLRMTLVVVAHPSKARLGSRKVAEMHGLQRAAGKSSSSDISQRCTSALSTALTSPASTRRSP